MKNNELTEVNATTPSLEGLPQEVIEYVHGLMAENAAYKSAEIMEFLRLVECMAGDYNDSNHGDAREWIRHIAKASSYFEDKHGDTPWGRMKGLATPNTDAAIAEIESVGAEKMFNLVEPAVRNYCNPLVTEFVISMLESLSDNLRAGRKG